MRLACEPTCRPLSPSPGCNAVVDDNRRATEHWYRRLNCPQMVHPRTQRPLLARFNFRGFALQHSRRLHRVVLDDANPTLPDGTEGKLGLVRDAELPHRHHVERCVQYTGDLRRHGNAAPRQTKNDCVRVVPSKKTCGEPAPCVGTIRELHAFTVRDRVQRNR